MLNGTYFLELVVLVIPTWFSKEYLYNRMDLVITSQISI